MPILNTNKLKIKLKGKIVMVILPLILIIPIWLLRGNMYLCMEIFFFIYVIRIIKAKWFNHLICISMNFYL